MALERTFEEIAEKVDSETQLTHTAHECSLDTGVYSKNVRFFLRPPIHISLGKRPPYPSVPTSNTLDFRLEVDAGRIIDVPEKDRKDAYRKAREEFFLKCDNFHSDDIIEVTIDSDLRRKHLENFRGTPVEHIPMIYCPVGSLIGKYIVADVVDVKIIGAGGNIF